MSTLRWPPEGCPVGPAPESVKVGFSEICVAGGEHPFVAPWFFRALQYLDGLELISTAFHDDPFYPDHPIFFFTESRSDELRHGMVRSHPVVCGGDDIVAGFEPDDVADLLLTLAVASFQGLEPVSLLAEPKLLLDPAGEPILCDRTSLRSLSWNRGT